MAEFKINWKIIPVLVLLGFIIKTFYCVYTNAVDVIYMDEWDMIHPGLMDKNFNLAWLFNFHNEHRIVPTKLVAWFGFLIDGWNIRHQIIFNYFVFLSMLFALYKAIPFKHPLLPLLFIPMCSNIHAFNFLTAFQSQFCFVLLFAFLAIYFGFQKDRPLLFAFFTLCSMFSMTFITGVGLLVAYLLKGKKADWRAVLIILAGILLFLCGIEVCTESAKTFPNQFLFWGYGSFLFAKSVFNYDMTNLQILPFLLICFAGLFYVIKKKPPLTYWAFIITGLLLLGGITVGRGVDAQITSRHFMALSFLTPVIGALLFEIKKEKLAFLFIVLILFSYFPAFNRAPYKGIKAQRLDGMEEVIKNAKEGNRLFQTSLYNKDFELERVEYGKKLGVHSLKDIEIKQ